MNLSGNKLQGKQAIWYNSSKHFYSELLQLLELIGNDGLHGPPIKSCPEDETSSEGHERIEDKINDQPEAWVPWSFVVLKLNDLPFNFGGAVITFAANRTGAHHLKESSHRTTSILTQ
ncbi:hypothetical protein SADUNF_Sadunf10G0060200 [Salix dunnii]|uniref:Uncharacterized protein n=1 Tax=Salix dunnii TaxID=1413687 RepID=A0A835JM52_9ROSI|nr:hypothetical protein SADUNF_Sadunf10G0060200 [Salix dunnii]